MALGPPQPPPGLQQASESTPLTNAMRVSPARLDGDPSAFHTEEEITALKKEKDMIAFLASRRAKQVATRTRRYQKKNPKAGAGREVTYEKEPPDIQGKMRAAREKEWANWQKYTNGKWITEAEFKEMQRKDPKLKAIPTRWVETNKAEIGEPAVMKSRIVVRGDLEDSSKMRTDSPTVSQVMIATTMCLAACRDTDIWAGDISAAFLQGSAMDRTLVLKMPKGPPGGDPPGDYYVVTSTVYGTKDARKGWYKNLHQTMIQKGFKAVPHEAAAYSLVNDKGELEGLAIVHGDDLLWTGGAEVERRMQEVCDVYKFGKMEKNVFKYCGRDVVKDKDGIHITCPNLIDRVRPIYLTAEERKKKEAKITEVHRQQLRSIIGSLAWLARVCRPDLAYAVSKLQSNVHTATFEDIRYANTVIAIAHKTKTAGIHYPLQAFRFEDAVIIGLQDSSFANDGINAEGKKLGFRSQSGRLLTIVFGTT